MSGNKPIEEKTTFCVAVFYPDDWERYGGVHKFDTKKEAVKKRNLLLKLYDHVHIWKVTTERVEL